MRTLQVLVDQRQSVVDAVNAVKESDVLRVSTLALNVAAHRLENLIHDRRLALASQQADKPREQARG